MKEIDRIIKPEDLIEGNIPVFDTTPKNVPQRLFEVSKVLERLMTRRDANKRKR